MIEPNPDHDQFFVGYLKAPAAHTRFNVLLVGLIMLWIGATAFVLVLTMRDPGPANWNLSNEQTWEGTLLESPYPTLIPKNYPDSPAMLVVSSGKHSAHEQLRDSYGQYVQIRGFELKRDGRYLIELSPDDQAVKPAPNQSTQSLPVLERETSEPVELVGEIVDGKCYHGAMKPGDGIGHRSCAILCLEGGLPPTFIAKTDIGDVPYPLLLVDGSTVLPPQVTRLAGSRVQIKAYQSTFAGLRILEASSEDISPIPLLSHSMLNP